MQILIFKGDIHINGNGRDTYKFRAIHPGILLLNFSFYTLLTVLPNEASYFSQTLLITQAGVIVYDFLALKLLV